MGSIKLCPFELALEYLLKINLCLSVKPGLPVSFSHTSSFAIGGSYIKYTQFLGVFTPSPLRLQNDVIVAK